MFSRVYEEYRRGRKGLLRSCKLRKTFDLENKNSKLLTITVNYGTLLIFICFMGSKLKFRILILAITNGSSLTLFS
jgi:hypothetical protein